MRIIGDFVQYIEEQINKDLSAEEIAKASHVFPSAFRRALRCSAASRYRNTSAAVGLRSREKGLVSTDEKEIDIALKHGYNSPDSFTKAFMPFYGMTPARAGKDGAMLKSLAPLKIRFSLEGDELMDFRIVSGELWMTSISAKSGFPSKK